MEENARECDRLHNEIFQKTKEIARAAGVDDNKKLEKIVDAVKFLSDVEDLAEEVRIPYLHEFKAKISNQETWFEIDKEMKRWEAWPLKPKSGRMEWKRGASDRE
ncbi:hypothetical protein ES332_D04G102400v1 [Gossypium tomentosum]|uniref:Uncharacterized protein n=1 Tax=Gossypium tomentosum TaxID=34277 RepID=A0A5D2LC93_GOSTO|nr:hypothetical protein ES332_D04G102400v1 [Gossypium tomentosum]